MNLIIIIMGNFHDWRWMVEASYILFNIHNVHGRLARVPRIKLPYRLFKAPRPLYIYRHQLESHISHQSTQHITHTNTQHLSLWIPKLFCALLWHSSSMVWYIPNSRYYLAKCFHRYSFYFQPGYYMMINLKLSMHL